LILEDAMNDKIRSLGLLGSIGIACVLCGCSGSPDESADAQGASSPSSDDLSGTTSSSEATPDPVATLTLENGNQLEFYDFGERALVMETGLAGVAPIVDVDSGSDSLVATWDRYANGSPARTGCLHSSGSVCTKRASRVA
jgi:hypothetical protein